MFRVELITHLSAEPDEFQSQWSELATASPYATVFQTPQWLVTWWHKLGSTTPLRSLNILAFYDQDRLVGVAPLVMSGWYGLLLRRLSFMGAGASDYVDIICRAGFEVEVCTSLIQYLVSNNSWDLLDIREARDGGVVRTFLLASATALRSSELSLEPCPFLPLPIESDATENWAQLLKSYSKKTRANVNYYDRTLGKTFEVEHSLAATDEAIETAFASLFELHARRWNERWLPGVFSSERVRQFHISAGQLLNKIGALRLRQIMLDGHVVAVLYVFAYNGCSCYYQGGFDPRLAKYSLGSVLIARAIRGAIEEEHTTFDFLRGNEDYKYRWTKGQHKLNSRIFLAKSNIVMPFATKIHNLEQLIEVNAKKAFAKGFVQKKRKPQDDAVSED